MGGSPKTARGEMGADRQRVSSVGQRMGKTTDKPKKPKKQRMRYVTNGAADGERLGRENAMSRLIRLIGNLGAGDFQGFVFCGG